MESRLIFESDKTYIRNVNWIKQSSESEWIYYNAKKIGNNFIKKIVREILSGESFYVIVDKNESGEFYEQNISEKIKPLFGKTEFKIWDKNFKNVMEFKIEVYRIGINASR
jgi:hypothetical protein